jgi:hypothetical protein
MSRRRCFDCGTTGDEAAFPGKRKPTRQPDLCTDCVAERERLLEARPVAVAGPAPPLARPVPVQTRAAYRAAYRHRAKLAQGDLVDLLVPPP